MEFSCRCHSTTGGITSSTLLPFGLWAPGIDQQQKYTSTYKYRIFHIWSFLVGAIRQQVESLVQRSFPLGYGLLV